MPPPRVLHLCHALRAGGLERVVVDLARHARRRGHDDRILLFDCTHVDPTRDLDPGDVPVTCIARRRGVDLGCVQRIARHLRAAPPRIVHAHNDSAACYATLACRLVPAAVRPRVVVTFHNRPVHASVRARLATRLACRHAAAVVSVSADLASWLAAAGWTNRAVVIAHGIDLERFAPPAVQTTSPSLRIGMVARLAVGKRHDLLLAAVDRLQREGVAIELHLAGDGPQAARVDAALRALPGGRRTPHVGDVPAFLTDLDVACLLSDHEGAPRAVLEAMACGLPVVASAVGGVPELVDDGAAVLVSNDVDSLASALRELLDPGRRRVIGARARRMVGRRHGLESTIASYEALFDG